MKKSTLPRILLSLLPLIAAPLSASIAQAMPISIGIFGDINGTECQTKYPENSLLAFDQMISNFPLDHILNSGDAVHGECFRYSGGTPYADVVLSMWKEFDIQFLQKSRALGIFTVLAPGNHDAPFLEKDNRDTFRIENEIFQKYWMSKKSSLGVRPILVPGIKDGYPFYWAYKLNNICNHPASMIYFSIFEKTFDIVFGAFIGVNAGHLGAQ